MALGWDQIFTSAEMAEAVMREIRVPVYPLALRPERVDPGVSPTFTMRIASPEEESEFFRHEHGQAYDIAIPESQTRTVRIAEDMNRVPPATLETLQDRFEEISRVFRARIDLALFMDLPGLGITDASMGQSRDPDRPPPLAAPSSRLPSYRPRG